MCGALPGSFTKSRRGMKLRFTKPSALVIRTIWPTAVSLSVSSDLMNRTGDVILEYELVRCFCHYAPSFSRSSSHHSWATSKPSIRSLQGGKVLLESPESLDNHRLPSGDCHSPTIRNPVKTAPSRSS